MPDDFPGAQLEPEARHFGCAYDTDGSMVRLKPADVSVCGTVPEGCSAGGGGAWALPWGGSDEYDTDGTMVRLMLSGCACRTL